MENVTELETATATMRWRGPMLKPCPMCGGQADYFTGKPGATLRVVCQGCGLRTGAAASAEAVGKAWNRRTTEGARLLSLHELLNSAYGYAGDDGGCAVWIEARGGRLFGALLRVGLDLGEQAVGELTTSGAYRDWTEEEIRAEGVDWRIWDRKPTGDDRAAAWNGESWRPRGAMAKQPKEGNQR